MKNTSRFILYFIIVFAAYILSLTTANAQSCNFYEARYRNVCGPCKKCVPIHNYYPPRYLRYDPAIDKRIPWGEEGHLPYNPYWYWWGTCQSDPASCPPHPKPQVCPLRVLYPDAIQQTGNELKNPNGIDSYQLQIDASNCHTSNNVNECCSHSQCPDLCVLLVSTYPSDIDCPSPTNPNAQCSKLQTAINTYRQVDPQSSIVDIAAALAGISPAALINDLGGSFDMALFCQGYCPSSTPALEKVETIHAADFQVKKADEFLHDIKPSYFSRSATRDRFGRLKWRAPQRKQF